MHRIYYYEAPGEVDGEEYCPFCDDIFPFIFDYEQKDLEVTCPGCGRRMMLCSMCDEECDWVEKYGCRMDKSHVSESVVIYWPSGTAVYALGKKEALFTYEGVILLEKAIEQFSVWEATFDHARIEDAKIMVRMNEKLIKVLYLKKDWVIDHEEDVQQ